jgi:four helix bundle protein
VAKYEDLRVWEKAHALTLGIYAATAELPRQEVYGLTAQMRGSSSSIAANIAEGCGRGSDTELVRFLKISQGSAAELHYQLRLARDLGFLTNETHDRLSQDTLEVQRMLASLMQSLSPRRPRLKTKD